MPDDLPGARPDHYFSPHPQGPSSPRLIQVTVRGLALQLWTDRGVFSYGELDRGSRLLAETMRLPESGDVLDWGAGYGALGLVAARLYPACRVALVEVNERAAALATRNLALNGAGNAEVIVGEAPAALGDRRFDAVVSNPPLHLGKAAVEQVIAEAARRLRPAGTLWLVVPTRKGARGFLESMQQQFAEAGTATISGGFRILYARQAR